MASPSQKSIQVSAQVMFCFECRREHEPQTNWFDQWRRENEELNLRFSRVCEEAEPQYVARYILREQLHNKSGSSTL